MADRLFDAGAIDQTLAVAERMTRFDPCSEHAARLVMRARWQAGDDDGVRHARSEEHTSELQSLMRISYAVFCLKKKKNYIQQQTRTQRNTQELKMKQLHSNQKK